MIGNEITLVAGPTVQSRVDTQSAVQAPAPKLENNLPEPQPDYTVSSIRVDVNLDMAILEFKSFETGDIIRQYPTEKQIAGYQRAAQLEESRSAREDAFAANVASVTQETPQPSTNDVTPQSVSTETANNGGSASSGNVTAGTAQLSDSSSVS